MTGIKEFFQNLVENDVISQEPANYDAATLKIYIAHLEAENAELRETLSKMETVEKELRERLKKVGKLPCEVGDTLYEPFINRIREWIVDSIYVFSLGINVNCERKDDCRWHDHFAIRENSNDFESRVYLTREAAEARLKEINEENDD